MGRLQPILLRTGYMMVLSVTWCSMMFMDFPCLHVVLQNWDVESRSDQRWPTSVRTVRSRVATIATSRRSCRMAMKWISYTSGWRSQMAMRAVWRMWRMWRRRFVTAGWFKLPAFFFVSCMSTRHVFFVLDLSNFSTLQLELAQHPLFISSIHFGVTMGKFIKQTSFITPMRYALGRAGRPPRPWSLHPLRHR